ncbi:MAG: hypothetical protein MUD12_17310, partial [Spirochaetes bacterium]|nr:hypothetical protein [Spirochaetota bacterium]
MDLVVNKDRIKTSGFSNIQRAVLSPDKRYILLVTDSSKHILFDCGREVIVKDDAKTEKMLAIKTPWCNQGMHCYYKDLQFVGPVPRYRVDIKCYAQPGFSESDNKQRTMATPDLEGMWGTICGIELVDTLTTDKIEKIEREIIIKNWYFSRDKLVVYFYNPLFHQNYHCLQFYNLSDLKEALKLKIKVNAALGYGFSSMSSDANTSILLFHNNRLIQFFDFKTMKYLGCLLMIDDKNWFAASSTGEYDGTDESLDF